MRYFYILMILALNIPIQASEATSEVPFKIDRKTWAGQYVWDKSEGKTSAPALKISDTSLKSGSYAISDFIKINAQQGYKISAYCKTNKDVTSESVIYVRLCDAKGKTLADVASKGTKSTDWVKLICRIPVAKIPANTTTCRIILQAARGAAKETGTAWFDDVKVIPIDKQLKKKVIEPGIEIGRDFFIKTLPSALPLKFANNEMQRCKILELSWRNFNKISSLLFKNNDEACSLNISYWNDQQQQWVTAGKFVSRPTESEHYTAVSLSSLPATRKLLLNFTQPTLLNNLKVYVKPTIKENWQASWIWFTKQRIEHVTRFVRKTFTIDGAINRAYFQGTGDDSVIFWLNGKKIVSNADWKLPVQADITKLLVQGKNVIAAKIHQDRYAAGVLAEIDINYHDGSNYKIITNNSWKNSGIQTAGWQSRDFDDSAWKPCVELGIPPKGVWSAIPYKNNAIKKQLTLLATSLPKVVKAGKKLVITFDLKFADNIVEKLPISLSMSRHGKTFIKKTINNSSPVRNKNGFTRLKTTIQLPEVLYPGKYIFKLNVPYCAVKWHGKIWQQTVLIKNNHQPLPAQSELKPLNGTPCLYINNKPYWSMFYTSIYDFGMEPVNNQAFAGAGLKIVQCYVNPVSPREGEFDFTAIDRDVMAIIVNNPQAMIILKPGFRDCVPPWFVQKYPEELVILDAGKKLSRPSLASQKWRKVAGTMLKKMIEHVNSSPYADRVVGYFVREGEEGQWMHYWGSNKLHDKNSLSDYSAPMRNYFRNWLKHKYKTEQALRRAWHDNSVTFATAKIPTREARIAPSSGVFKDPINRQVIDYAEVLSDVICDGIISYAKIVKQTTHNKSLMIAYFGHIIDLGGRFLGEQVGYLKQRRVINCPDIDYLAGPLSYDEILRDIGGPSSFDSPPPATLKLQNKIWLNEDDVRTHITNPPGYAFSIRTPHQTDEMMAREFAKALCAGAGLYWLNISGGKRYWFDDLQTMNTIGKLNKLAQDSIHNNLSSVSEIAVIMSDKSLLYMRMLEQNSKQDAIVQQAILEQREQISRIGAPFDEYLLDDFLDPAMPQYNLYIFLNAFYMTDDERQAIKKKLKKNHATALWFYAPGYITEDGFSLSAMQELTGFNIDKLNIASNIKLTINASNPLLPGYSKVLTLPDARTIKPIFFATATSHCIGTLATNQQLGLAQNNGHNYNSYYCSAPILPAELLRAIAKKAQVHIYSSNNDAVYACKDYLAIHTSKKTGARIITLPEPVEIIQLYPIYKQLGRKDKLTFTSNAPLTKIFKIK